MVSRTLHPGFTQQCSTSRWAGSVLCSAAMARTSRAAVAGGTPRARAMSFGERPLARSVRIFAVCSSLSMTEILSVEDAAFTTTRRVCGRGSRLLTGGAWRGPDPLGEVSTRFGAGIRVVAGARRSPGSAVEAFQRFRPDDSRELVTTAAPATPANPHHEHTPRGGRVRIRRLGFDSLRACSPDPLHPNRFGGSG